ncbi:RRP12-like protein [Contarinia nasturtii]|uniref:RRP12-like protein n=1 Tax=Contarinia nasturtii TaxID=265458 RepID=UPI0012D3A8B0|nr:RRP12-like protein [Contarinia nasturtii]
MGKFRSKLKRHSKGAKWARGQSATSNPENKKHRNAARSRFFQPNLNTDIKPSTTNGVTSLTVEAVTKHDARQLYTGDDKIAKSVASTKSQPTVNDIANSMNLSLNSLSLNDDLHDDQSYAKTFQTFGSQYSSCTNMTFNKFLNRFQQSSDQHKEMLAILSAITEVIKERNGTQSSTEFFLGLMETLEATKKETEIIATLSLLTMVIKSVPQPILRKKFADTGDIFLQLLEHLADNENQNVLRSIIGCISVLLRAQDYASWSAGLTLKLFNQVLSFIIHTKPRIRKAAQRAIESIIHGCCFMSATIQPDQKESSQIVTHPAGTHVTKFCVEQFKVENLTKSQNVVLYTIELLKKILNGLKNEDIKEICEYILSIMVTSKSNIQKNCFDTLHHLFQSKSPNLSQDLVGKLIAAIYDYQPEQNDVNLILAWLNVMRCGHVCLTSFNVSKCLSELPRFITICAGNLWKSDNLQIATGVYHTIKELFEECIAPGMNTDLHRKPIARIISELTKCLNEPFGFISQQIIGVFQTVFEICGRNFGDILQSPLNQIASRYDETASKQIQIENVVRAAISTMGPEAAFIAVPFTDVNGDVNISRLWVLQALKKAIAGSSFEFFYCKILPLANKCYEQWKYHQSEGNLAAARTNELFYIQLWDLFPSFCEQPKDLNKFGSIAKILGDVLKNRVEIRVAVFDGLMKLLQNANDESKIQLAKFSRNYLNILLNIFIKKPNGSEEHNSREHALKVIIEYLKVTPKDVLTELFNSIHHEYKSKEDQIGASDETKKAQHSGLFAYQAYFELLIVLAVYQSAEQLNELFINYIEPTLRNAKKNGITQLIKERQIKSYHLLHNILKCENTGCEKFVNENLLQIQKVLLNTLQNRKNSSQDLRLSCLLLLIEKQESRLQHNSKLISRTIPEIVISFNSQNPKENVALKLLLKIGHIYQHANKVSDFVELLMSGLDAEADDSVMSNTIQVLQAILQNFTDQLTLTLLNSILEQVLAQLITGSRQKVKAAIAFVLVFVKILPASYVANHLPNIVKAMSAMKPDTKRFYRKQLGFTYKRLCKRFTSEEIVKLVPGNDEITHKKLKNIRKAISRSKRQKIAEKDGSDDDGLGDEAENDPDDILADSDSDEELQEDILMDTDGDQQSERPKKKMHKKEEKYIFENSETIVDLADIKAMSSIASTKPTKDVGESVGNKKTKVKDPNRGFKTDTSGKLIIEEPKRSGNKANYSDSETEDEDTGEGNKQTPVESDSEDELTENVTAKSRKRKANSSLSQASGKTGTSSKYVAGGKGIHRPLSEAASVRSGYTNGTSKTGHGSEYRAKKSKGDMKKKNTLDPYAYIPLSRNTLNKRKRAKNSGQFKSIINAAKKGAAAGSKRRKT